jgi:hypothetical protein
VIRGYIDAGRPYVSCLLFIPRLSAGGQIDFLVDTGSDRTVIHPGDAARLGIEEEAFAGLAQTTAVGVGGTALEYFEAAFILLRHQDDRIDNILVRLSFAVPTPDNALYPSVLGRDLISYYRLVFEQRAGLVTLENAAQQA